MDDDLIKLVNKLQDTFSNLGTCLVRTTPPCPSFDQLDTLLFPDQWVDFFRRGVRYAPVGRCKKGLATPSRAPLPELLVYRSAVNPRVNPVFLKSEYDIFFALGDVICLRILLASSVATFSRAVRVS
jgi:hypothetical protein